MDEHGLEKAHVFGYSMGGYAALVAALGHPERFEKIVTLGTKFDWNPATASREVGMLNPAIIEQKVPAFAARLEAMHQPVPWKDVVNATARFMTALGYHPDLDTAGMGRIVNECLLMVGDQDVTAGVEATRTAAVCIPKASFRVLNATPHPVEKVDMSTISQEILKFLS
jgi:pimeloyl-ACP methyl ester carboxylesterase